MTYAELRELAEAATPGPWKASREDMDSYAPSADGLEPVAFVYRDPEPRIGVFGAAFREDSRFIAAANPQTVLDLLEAPEWLGRKLVEMKLLHQAALDELRRESSWAETAHIAYLGSVDERERMREALVALLECAEECVDEGPPGAQVQSDELKAAIAGGREALGGEG